LTPAIFAVLIAVAISGCGFGAGPLRVAVGSALGEVAEELAGRYRVAYPDRRVEVISAGSVDLARRVAAGELEADVLLLSDSALFGELLQPQWTSFQLRYATDRMVLALGEELELEAGDWPAGLLAPEIRVAAADPDLSSVGYRFGFVLRLHDRAHPERPVAEAILARADAAEQYRDAASLAAALGAGEIDATLLYASLARSHDLRSIELAPAIDLGAVHLAAVYAPVSVPAAAGRALRPAAPIVHAVSIPDAGRRRAAALDYLRLALGAEGREVLSLRGLTPVIGADRPVSFDLPADVEAVLQATAK